MTLDEFQKAELQIGKIVSAERVEGSEKLLKLQVDLGSETRQILSGIAKSYAPEDLLNKEVVLVTNLEPRVFNLKGTDSTSSQQVVSQGMILAAHGEGGAPVLLSPWQEVAPGSMIT